MEHFNVLLRRSVLWLPVLIAIVITIILQLSAEDDDDAVLSTGPESIKPRTRMLTAEDIELSVTAIGEVVAARETSIRAQVSGLIVSVNPALINGKPLQRNEVLFELEAIDYRLQVAQAKRELALAQLNYQEVRAQQQQADEDRQSLPDQHYTDLALFIPQMAFAKARIVAAEANLAKAERDLQRTVIRAPYDGYVIGRLANPGDFVQRGDLLLRIFDHRELHVEIAMPKADFSAMLRMQALFANDRLNRAQGSSSRQLPSIAVSERWGTQRAELQANAVIVGANLDPASRMQPLTLVINNSSKLTGLHVKPGSVVNATLSFGTLNGVFRLDRRWLSDEDRILILDNNGAVSEQAITVVYGDQQQLFFYPAQQTESLNIIVGGEVAIEAVNHLTVSGQYPGW